MTSRYFLILVISSIFLSLAPFILVVFFYGSIPPVPFEIIDDSFYYFSRAMEIVQGYPFLGNQYIFEFRNYISPSFFLADWIWSLPIFLGFSIFSTTIINSFFSFLLLGVLIFYILDYFKLDKKIIYFSTIFIFLNSFWYIMRPVSMQVIFPFFIIFILSALYFLKYPDLWKTRIIFGISTTLSLYVYTYLAQIVLVVLVFLFLASILKSLIDYKKMIIPILISVFMTIPFVYYTYNQLNTPFYFESLYRIGLVNTHTVGFAGIFYFFLGVICCLVIYIQKDIFEKNDFKLFFIISLSLTLTSVSNIFTGKDLETAIHIGRFVDIWIVLVFVISLYKQRMNISKFRFKSIYFLSIFFLIISFAYLNLYQFKIWSNIKNYTSKIDDISSPIKWLDNNNQTVIFANEYISGLIPIMTKHYVLFHPYSVLQIMPDKEIEERYMMSKIFEKVTPLTFKKDFRKFSGVGYAIHRANVLNREVKICKIINFFRGDKDCGQFTDSYQLKKEEYFLDLYNRFNQLQKDKISNLKKYKISFIVLDTKNDKWLLPKGLNKVFDDGRYQIYDIR